MVTSPETVDLHSAKFCSSSVCVTFRLHSFLLGTTGELETTTIFLWKVELLEYHLKSSDIELSDNMMAQTRYYLASLEKQRLQTLCFWNGCNIGVSSSKLRV